VAISDQEEAVAAVKRLIGLAGHINVAVVEELFDATFYGLGLAPGDILPRVRYPLSSSLNDGRRSMDVHQSTAIRRGFASSAFGSTRVSTPSFICALILYSSI
jgi:hypothetical protein